MADEARLHELLDIYEQAQKEGDTVTAQKVKAAYLSESRQGSAPAQDAGVKTYTSTRPGRPLTYTAPVNDTRSAGAHLTDLGKGLLEVPASVVSGTAGAATGGLAGLGSLATGGGMDNAANAVRSIQDSLTYAPRSEFGQQALSSAALPAELLNRAGEKTAEVTGSPALGALVNTAGNAALMALGAKKGAPPRSPFEGPVKKVTGNMTPTESHAANVNTLLRNDVPLSKAQTGKGFIAEQMKSAARAANTVLGESDMPEIQRQAFTAAVLKKAGMDATRATPDVMAQLKDQVGTVYDDLHSRVPTLVDAKDTQAIHDIMIKAGREDAAPVAAQAQGLLDRKNPSTGQIGQISGNESQAVRSALVRLQQSSNVSTKHWAGELKDALDNAFEKHATPEDAAAMKAVRERFIKMKQIEDAVGTDPNGYIAPTRLYNILTQKKNRGASIYGKGGQEMIDLARAGKDVLPEKVANSGTPQRHADVGKVIGLINNPKKALEVTGMVLGGRALNEAGALNKTASKYAAHAAAMERARRLAAIAAIAAQQRQQQ
jgi:hypothetical protein